jgi:outer membrane biosynthesis protein TonB
MDTCLHDFIQPASGGSGPGTGAGYTGFHHFTERPHHRFGNREHAGQPQISPEGIDQPAGVIYCPEPRYPGVLAEFGFDGDVDLQFVIDTSGRAELDDLVVTAASHPGFVEPARRAIAKCRYRPARKGGRAVRFLVRQRVRYHLRDEP